MVKVAHTAEVFYPIASLKVVAWQRKASQRCIFRWRAAVLPPTANTASMRWAAIFSDMRRTTREVLLGCSCLQHRGPTRHSSNLGGRCYRFGYGVAIDDKEALRLYRLAADAAFPDAFESLAELAADVDEEIYWLERCVAAGRAVGSKLKSAQKKREKTMSFGLG